MSKNYNEDMMLEVIKLLMEYQLNAKDYKAYLSKLGDTGALVQEGKADAFETSVKVLCEAFELSFEELKKQFSKEEN